MRTAVRIVIVLALVSMVITASAGSAFAKTPSTSSIWKSVQALQKQVKTLQTQNAAQAATIGTLNAQLASRQASDTALTNSLVALWADHLAVKANKALLLGPYVTVDPNAENGVKGPNILFSGANLHVVSGSGKTDDGGNLTGLGNLIVGYDENPNNVYRAGSHTLVVGTGHGWASYGGFVAGSNNSLIKPYSSVSGGFGNVSNGLASSVSGGNQVWMSSDYGWATAGYHNP